MMNTAESLDIKVVFDASKRRGSRGFARTASIRRIGSRRQTASLFAAFNLFVAAGMYYAVWWKVDPYIYITLLKKTPIDVPADFASGGFFVAAPSPDLSDQGNGVPGAHSTQPTPSPLWSPKTAQFVIPVAAYGWLALATVGACAVALAAGACVGRDRGAVTRRIGFILSFGLAAGLAYAVYLALSTVDWGTLAGTILEKVAKLQLSMKYKPNHLRFAMGGLLLFAMSVGLIFGRRLRGVFRFTAGLLILAGLASAAGIYLWHKCDALETHWPIAVLMGVAFIVHSAWGWLLLAASRRLG